MPFCLLSMHLKVIGSPAKMVICLPKPLKRVYQQRIYLPLKFAHLTVIVGIQCIKKDSEKLCALKSLEIPANKRHDWSINFTPLIIMYNPKIL